MIEVGIIGWRGMVGSVLLERMRIERDFDLIEPVFFSTSQAGAAAPDVIAKKAATKKVFRSIHYLVRTLCFMRCQTAYCQNGRLTSHL